MDIKSQNFKNAVSKLIPFKNSSTCVQASLENNLTFKRISHIAGKLCIYEKQVYYYISVFAQRVNLNTCKFIAFGGADLPSV